jgi:ketosteroid isomerase-like protein
MRDETWGGENYVMKNAPNPAVEAFRSYTAAFQALDPKAVAAHFHEPALMITPKGIDSLPNAAAVEQAYARIMSELPAQRYARTEFSQVDERRLGDDLTMLTGAGTWVDTSGKSFMPFGMTYVLRRTGQSWRIVTAIIHSANAK